MSIAYNLIHLAADESEETALGAAQALQDALETMTMVGSDEEIVAASFLLANVNQGVTEILEGKLITIAKGIYNGRTH